MKQLLTIVLFFAFIGLIRGQNNFLGKSQEYITQFYEKNNNFSMVIDTLTEDNILMTFKSLQQYPYYTYEINTKKNVCVSYGLVSKDENILQTYFELLEFAGKLVKKDKFSHSWIYEIRNGEKVRYYIIKQPYLDDQNSLRRKLFYVLIREKTLLPDL
jgi:hypothetical protein